MSSIAVANNKLIELFNQFSLSARNATDSISTIIVDKGERHLTLTDRPLGTKLHFSLPSLPQYPGDTNSLVGLYVYIEIPFYAKLHTMINYDENLELLTIRNVSLCYDEIDFGPMTTPISERATFTIKSFISLFKEVCKKKTAFMENLIRNRFEISGAVSFETLSNVPGPMGKNDYLYFFDDENKVVFVNDITGTNTTSGINNIDRIFRRFNPPHVPMEKKGVCGWIESMLSPKPELPLTIDTKIKIVIVSVSLDKKSIIFLDEIYNHFSSSSKHNELSPIWAQLLSVDFRIIFR